MSQHSVTVSWKVVWKVCLKPGEVTPKCFKNSIVVNAPLSHCKDPGVHVTCQSWEDHGNVMNQYMKRPYKNQNTGVSTDLRSYTGLPIVDLYQCTAVFQTVEAILGRVDHYICWHGPACDHLSPPLLSCWHLSTTCT